MSLDAPWDLWRHAIMTLLGTSSKLLRKGARPTLLGILLLGATTALAGCPGSDTDASDAGTTPPDAAAVDASTTPPVDASASDGAIFDASTADASTADATADATSDAAAPDGGACGAAAAPTLPSATPDATFWQPDGEVRALAWSDDSSKLVVGGNFTQVKSPDGTMTQSATNLTVLDATTGQPIAGYPAVTGEIDDISVVGDTVYVVGGVTQAGGMARTRAFAFSLSSKTVSAWAPTFAGTTPFLPSVRLVRATPTAIFVGGYFTSAGGAARTNVAALDPTTGTATAWAPPALGTQAAQDITVRALAVAADRVFVGGGSGIDMTGGDGVRRRNVVALDRTSAALLPWSPVGITPDSVYALDVSGDRVVVGRPQSGDLTAPALFAADTRTGEVCWKTSLGNAQGFYRAGVARGVVFGGGLTGTLFTASSSYKAFALGSGSPLTWGGDLFATDGSAGTVEDIAVAPNGAVAMTGNRVAKGALTTGAPKLMVHKP